jgi:hypothetical protein
LFDKQLAPGNSLREETVQEEGAIAGQRQLEVLEQELGR